MLITCYIKNDALMVVGTHERLRYATPAERKAQPNVWFEADVAVGTLRRCAPRLWAAFGQAQRSVAASKAMRRRDDD